MRSRGWIPNTTDLDAAEAAVCELREIESLDQTPGFAVAARRSNSAEPVTIKQFAWLGYIRRKGETQGVADFDVGGLAAGLAYAVTIAGPAGPDVGAAMLIALGGRRLAK